MSATPQTQNRPPARPKIEKDDILGIECRNVIYCGKPSSDRPDIHLVKEIIHTKSQGLVPYMRFIKDYKRPYWITKEAFRNHKQKKEWEDLHKLTKYESLQSDLTHSIMHSLNQFSQNPRLRTVCRSPYVYGADITSTSLIKHEYQRRFTKTGIDATAYNLAVLDIETSMQDETILMCTLSYKTRIVTAVRKDFVAGYTNVPERLNILMEQHLGETMKERGATWELVLVDNPEDCVITCMNRAHEWKPDFIEIWNIDFEMTKFLALHNAGRLNLADVMSDPCVPKDYRFFEYRKGMTQRKKANGEMDPIKPADQWHTVECPASFVFLDGMQIYRKVRQGDAMEQSYALKAILDKELGSSKLNPVPESEAYGDGAEWHEYMQDHHPLEYVIYNVGDCIRPEQLDEETQDFAIAVPVYSGVSDFQVFDSQPRRKVNELHFEFLEDNLVIGTTSDKMTDEIDEMTYDLKNWIITLPAHSVANNGLCLLEDAPLLRTSIRVHVADLDVSSSYPNNGAVLNISKHTTKAEFIRVDGIDEYTCRMQGLNLSGGPTNASEFCTTMLGLPNKLTLLEAYRNKRRSIA